MTPRTVAVLGATGCVGGSVSAALAEAGNRVVGVARRQPSGPHHGLDAFTSLDITTVDPGVLAKVLSAFDVKAVVNATGGWLDDEDAYERHHVHLVANLLTALRRMPSPPRLVQVGSIHEYGPVAAGTAISETTPPRPTTTYARTKLAGSEAVLRAAEIPGIVLRCVNVCGPGTPPASFLGSVVERLADTRPVRVTVAPGRRDYLDVRDLADAVVRASAASATGVVNIGSGTARSIPELLDLLLEAAGLPSSAIETTRGAVQSKGGDWTLADIRRAATELQWRPRITLADSMRAMWARAREVAV
ncbi:NAD-dependent epimerase/dehydratase family protein [Kibdelosporangium philippinense]|uniref:NAD-dependent epimerase/dehydratase family protein n=2 Tax=Kibdelosporangium philippinense TaxID=211113 RepID=A0ABS8Z370_9PSEU|nr:NAD-dependent epimerase/dehydratase family protein [Kibdelosporangium philippinense]MCE7002285.1 NAD-dependent epimerase/dehydratase family protein [Kibdelosporangium philippinense]